MTTFHATITWTSPTPTTEDAFSDLMHALTDHSAAGSIARDFTGGTITITTDTQTLDDALTTTLSAARTALAQLIPAATVTGIELLDDATRTEQMTQPLYPEVVGYAEIARMAGVTRQRAAQFKHLDGFPAPVIETQQGPLMSKAAIEAWLTERDERLGRTH